MASAVNGPTPGSVWSSARASASGSDAQALGVEAAVDRGLGEVVQPADLLRLRPGTSRASSSRSGRGNGRTTSPSIVDRVADALAEPRLDDRAPGAGRCAGRSRTR